MKTVYEQIAMFYAPDVCSQVLIYVREQHPLCEEAQLKIFELENVGEIIMTYIENYVLCDEAQVKMLALPKGEIFAKKYIQMKHSFCRKAHVKMFDLENAEAIVREYVQKHYLCDEAEMKVFELENERIDATSKDIAKVYTQAMNTFKALPEDEAEYLQFFAFICSLSFDVYVKKMIIEQLIDQLPEPEHNKKKK